MKAVITGITGLRNRGVEALVVPTIEQLQKRLPNLNVSVLTKTPDYDQLRLQQYEAKPISIAFPKTKLQKLRSQFVSFYKKPAPDKQSSVQAIQNASVVIASGGDVFSSDYGSLYQHLQPLELALDAGVPIVFLAQSIGPFKKDDEAQAWLRVARRSKLITVREKISYDYITQKLGLSTDLVKHTADPAFLLAPPPAAKVANMFSAYGITKDRPAIALSISQGITRYSGCDDDKHLKAWHQVVKMILDELDAQVLIIPHVQEIYASNDDRIAATNLLKSLEFDPRVRLAGADHSASEFKGFISACDMVIAERMHAAIAGLSSGVCTVVVGYSIKAEGIMSNLLGTDSLHNGLLIPIHDFLNADKTCATIRKAWNRRQEVANQLHEVLPKVKQDSASNFDMISEIIPSCQS
ncbi:polysaccharide pyruvyl transferase family protein [Fischerella sp. PCC 9605]|uniref:polysaccharide pyruvyl transferase family protein n=1 Tax=Fischerella sp. PCC 9605 TaxID=1173024 RepID=UPI00047D97FC|nr:polysaccharide pyruvyl transferase family protein [Fischerella sp. PCC 9605]